MTGGTVSGNIVLGGEIQHSGDTDTKLHFDTDTIKFDTAGSERARIDSSGRLGIGTPNPATTLDCNGIIRVPQDTFYQSGDGTGGWVELIKADSSNNTYIKNNKNRAIIFETGGTEKARIDFSGNLKFDSGYGSAATAYGCRAWVNFNGSGTVAIRASGNISSVTDNGTGDYTLNFSNAMPDANYAAIGNATSAVGGVVGIAVIPDYPTGTQTTTALRIQSTNTATSKFDAVNYSVAIFR